MDAPLEPACLLFHADLQPVLEQDDAGLDYYLFEGRRQLEETFRRFLGSEPHHTFDARAIEPTAIPDPHFAGRRRVRQIQLHAHLAILSLVRRGQRDASKYPRADAV